MANDFSHVKAGIQKTEEWLQGELGQIRTGRPTPALLDGITVDAYGSKMKLIELASISVEDARSLFIAPWDSSQIKAIEKALTIASIGGVGSDEKGVRLTVPELTTERRQELVKTVKQKLEDARVALRGERTRAIGDLEKKHADDEISEDELRRAKDEVQKLVDACTERLETLAHKKEVELTR